MDQLVVPKVCGWTTGNLGSYPAIYRLVHVRLWISAYLQDAGVHNTELLITTYLPSSPVV